MNNIVVLSISNLFFCIICEFNKCILRNISVYHTGQAKQRVLKGQGIFIIHDIFREMYSQNIEARAIHGRGLYAKIIISKNC